jgi:two-component system chemotaxis response regulator CheY
VADRHSGFISLRYLIVEDDTSVRQLIRHELTQLGITKISDASSALEAANMLEDALQALPIEMVISDWNMPFMSGLELLRKCRNHSSFRNVGFLMVTSVNDVNQIREAVVAGVDNYIVKPVTRDLLKEKLQLIFDKRFANKKPTS